MAPAAATPEAHWTAIPYPLQLTALRRTRPPPRLEPRDLPMRRAYRTSPMAIRAWSRPSRLPQRQAIPYALALRSLRSRVLSRARPPRPVLAITPLTSKFSLPMNQFLILE